RISSLVLPSSRCLTACLGRLPNIFVNFSTLMISLTSAPHYACTLVHPDVFSCVQKLFNIFPKLMIGFIYLLMIYKENRMDRALVLLLPHQFEILCKRQTFRSEEHTSELQSRFDLVCRLLLEKKKSIIYKYT